MSPPIDDIECCISTPWSIGPALWILLLLVAGSYMIHMYVWMRELARTSMEIGLCHDCLLSVGWTTGGRFDWGLRSVIQKDD